MDMLAGDARIYGDGLILADIFRFDESQPARLFLFYQLVILGNVSRMERLHFSEKDLCEKSVIIKEA